MSQSVWPCDHSQEDSYAAAKPLGELWAFVICPANPPAYWDDLFNLINGICTELGKQLGIVLRCRMSSARASYTPKSGVIYVQRISSSRISPAGTAM